MRPRWPFGALMVVGSALAWFWPLPDVLSNADTVMARVAAAGLSFMICLAAGAGWRSTDERAPRWVILAALFAVAATILLLIHFDATGNCIASYEGTQKIIGGRLQPYVQPQADATAAGLLFDAGGVPERVWTPESIRICRWRLSLVGIIPLPLFIAAACCVLQTGAIRLRLAPPLRVSKALPGGEPKPAYDAFISYRRAGPDREFALMLTQRLEALGLHVAIDVRDFRPNEHFLDEIERCIKESRFVLCVLSPRYLDSGNCVEEAIISKTLDMSERRRRIVPLILEPVELPIWLYGITGINFVDDSAIDPFNRLKTLFGVK